MALRGYVNAIIRKKIHESNKKAYQIGSPCTTFPKNYIELP